MLLLEWGCNSAIIAAISHYGGSIRYEVMRGEAVVQNSAVREKLPPTTFDVPTSGPSLSRNIQNYP